MRPLIISFSDNPHANKLKTAANQAQVGRGPDLRLLPKSPVETEKNIRQRSQSLTGKPILFDEAGNVQVALALFRLRFFAEHRKVDL